MLAANRSGFTLLRDADLSAKERGEKCPISTSQKMTFVTWVKDRKDE